MKQELKMLHHHSVRGLYITIESILIITMTFTNQSQIFASIPQFPLAINDLFQSLDFLHLSIPLFRLQ